MRSAQNLPCMHPALLWENSRSLLQKEKRQARDYERSLGGVGPEVFRGEEEGGGVRNGPGVARTILLLHIISVRSSKQPLMVRTFLKVYMELGSSFLFLQEQINDIIIITRDPCLRTTPYEFPWCTRRSR